MSRPAKERGTPFIWATWLSKVLSGENHCHWATWFRAHYEFDKQFSDFATENWVLDHTKLVDECARQFELAGYVVSLESQNWFRLKGGSGIVFAGCPDIVATKSEEVLVVDCKTGKKRASHEYQVLTYMLALPYAQSRYRTLQISGLVYYRDDSLVIQPSRIDADLRRDFRTYMAMLGGDEQPRRVPSFSECRFCDVASAYCPDRVEAMSDEPVPAEDLF